MSEIEIYTDGACTGNPGPGGWAAILIHPKKTKEISGACPDTTNNRMELTAVIEALTLLTRETSLTLYSDSAYIINAMTQGWTSKWQLNGWRTANKKPVENQDLWENLISLSKKHKIKWIKVPAHKDNHYNNIVDKLARDASKSIQNN